MKGRMLTDVMGFTVYWDRRTRFVAVLNEIIMDGAACLKNYQLQVWSPSNRSWLCIGWHEKLEKALIAAREVRDANPNPVRVLVESTGRIITF